MFKMSPLLFLIGFDSEKDGIIFYYFAFLGADFMYGPVTFGADFVHHFHSLDNTENVSFFYSVSDFDKRLGSRFRTRIKYSEQRRFKFVQIFERVAAGR